MQYEVQALVVIKGKLTTVSSWKGNSFVQAIIEVYSLSSLGADKLRISITF